MKLRVPLLLAAMHGSSTVLAASAAHGRKNVLYIVVDDLRAELPV
jgi:hypothetical protein